MRPLRRIVLVGLGVAVGVSLLMGLCLVTLKLGLPLGGLTRDQATSAAAHRLSSTTSTSAQWAVPGPLVFFRDGAGDAAAPKYRLVWAITFSGTFPPASCGPAPSPGQQPRCPSPNHTETVVIDYFSGEFIMAEIRR
jgi:hypothetical protein